MKTLHAKLFKNGGSQAVRLPKSCRFPAGLDEVAVRQEGRRIILEPLDDWSEAFLACLGSVRGPIPRPKWTAMRDPFA